MKIELKPIKLKDLFQEYKDDAEEGVVAYGGLLDVRPKYQREFVYKDEQRDAVIDTVRKGFPLNVMYWVKKDDGGFEVLDGQQRTLSICQYLSNDFSIKEEYFHTLTDDQQAQILNYELMVYFCEGNDSEKLEWFKTINIAGEKLYDQELRNAVYTGEWLTDAKRHFSKTGCPAMGLGDKYVKGVAIRQEILQLVLCWINDGAKGTPDEKIRQYMADHQHDANANELWLYFVQVINWVQTIFPTYRREMKGVSWGILYNEFGQQPLDTKKLEDEVAKLMADDEVQNKRGIYEYVLTRNEKYLNIRTFEQRISRAVYEKQRGICPICGGHFDIGDMEADHIIPWHKGGKTEKDNCQMLCMKCNRTKSGK